MSTTATSTSKFGSDNLATVLDASNNAALSVTYTTTGWVVSDNPFVWKGFPLTSYHDNKGHYSLAVVLESATLDDRSYIYKGQRYGMATNSAGESVYVVNSNGTDTGIAGTTVWRGTPLSYNAGGQMLATPVTVTVEQKAQIFVGGMPLKVVRSGRRWYLSVTDIGAAVPSSANTSAVTTTGLQLWLRSDSIAQSNGTALTTWNDSGPAGNNFTGSTTKPTFYTNVINGKPTVRFTGTQYMSLTDAGATSALNLTGPFTIFVVMKPTSWGNSTSMGLIGKKTDDTTNGWQLYNDTGQQYKINCRVNVQNNFFTSGTVTNGATNLWTVKRTGTNALWESLGRTDNTGSFPSSSTATSAPVNLGFSQTWSGYYIGDIAEVIIYNRALSSKEDATITTYLTQKYAL